MPAHSKPSRVPWIPLLGLGVLLLACLVYVGAYLRVGGGVLPNTTVAGVPVGGLSPAAAVTKLTRALTPRTTAPLNVQVRDQSLTIEPRSAGLTVDFKATVAATGRRTATPVGLWKAMFGKHDVAPAISVETTKLAASIDQLDRTLRGAGRDGGIRFDGMTPVAIPPARGIGIVKNKAMAALRSAYLSLDLVRLICPSRSSSRTCPTPRCNAS